MPTDTFDEKVRPDEFENVKTLGMTPAALADAQRAALAEHNLGLRHAFKAYKKAIMWSVLVSMVSTITSLPFGDS